MKDIIILGRKVHIKFVPEEKMEKLQKEAGVNHRIDGLFVADESTVYIWSGAEGDYMNRVLIHELIHAMLSFGGAARAIGEDNEEVVCECMENLLELFRNKPFVEYVSK